MTSDIFRGSMVAIVSPMKPDGELDLPAFEDLVRWQVESGTHGIVVTGTTGETPTLTFEEDAKLWEAAVRVVDGRVPVIAGAGSNNTRHAIEYSKRAKEVGADGTLQVTPYYNKPTQRGLLAHFRAVADAVDLPICLYSVPGRTALAIAPETVAELAKHPNIVALKEAGGSVDRVSEVRQRTDITILSGDDPLTLPMMAVGASGVISVAANVVPRETADLVEAVFEGEWEKARGLHERLYPLSRALFLETNPVPVKAAVAMMGKIGENYRLPLVPMEEGNRAKLRSAMEAFGLLP